MKKACSKLLKTIKENKLIVILFIAATLFFIYQHSISLSWDFNSYVLNGKYWFANGKYFEPLRPPLMPLIISLFSFLGWRTSEYIFIILTSFLFLYSSTKLAKSIKLNPTAFYAISLNLYLLVGGLINGTELLSLVFLELFLSFLIENRSASGFFLGLSALSRYTGLALFPIIFLHLNIKKILKSLFLFGATISFWFIYNYYKYGNFFTSIADQYANNILYRGYLIQPMQLFDFLQVQNVLIPFFFLGIAIAAFKLFRHTKSSKNSLLDLISGLKIEIIMFFLLFFSIYSYNNIPMKNARYLFNLLLPTFYFSYIGIRYIAQKTKNSKSSLTKIAFVIFVINISIALIIISNNEYDTPQTYNSAISKLDELNLSDCSIMSNGWVMLNYLGRSSKQFPRQLSINNRLEDGEIFVFFNKIEEPDYINNESFLKSLPIIYEHKDYIIIGMNRCLPISIFEETYLQQVDRFTFEVHEYHQNMNPCFTLFHNIPVFEKSCNLINLNGFKQDEYRKFN